MQSKRTRPSRRQFVRTFALGSASTIVGAPWVGTLLATLLGQGRAIAASDGQLNLQLTSFPPLLQSFGSVRIGLTPLNGAYPSGTFSPLIISRGTGDLFYALSSKCPHRGCAVLPFDGTTIACPCHGSQFSINGSLVQGPATSNLLSYPLSFDGLNTLKVTVPGLGYSITGCTVMSDPGQRLRLDFPTFAQVSYEIRFRATAQEAWSVVPFATTSAGTADNSVLTGNGLPASVFVDRSTLSGFYSVALLIKEV
jgi:Rieske Fe-S protein